MFFLLSAPSSRSGLGPRLSALQSFESHFTTWKVEMSPRFRGRRLRDLDFFRWKHRDFGSGGTNVPGRSLPRPRFSPCSAPMNRNSHEKPNGKISCSSCRFSSKPQSFAESERPDQFWIFLSLTGCKQPPAPSPLARS